MKLRIAGSVLGLVMALGIAGTALADDCANVSRATPSNISADSGPVIRGNWVYLPSVDPSAPPIWGFITPGTDLSAFGITQPDANGNYTNGKTVALLGVSANCQNPGGTSRQTSNGIQSGCGQ